MNEVYLEWIFPLFLSTLVHLISLQKSEEKLRIAAFGGNTDLVIKLLDEEVNVNATDKVRCVYTVSAVSI